MLGTIQDFMSRKQAEYGEKFDASDLAPKFFSAYNDKRRIRVKVDGEVMTGTVGVTTGWKPVFLLMRSRRSVGSSVLLTNDVEFTTEKMRARKPYQPTTGQACGCRRGVQRDNCPACEGTGMQIDFAAVRVCECPDYKRVGHQATCRFSI